MLFNSNKDFVRYINRQKVGNGNSEDKMPDITKVSPERQKDKISEMSVFGHGHKNDIDFAHKRNSEIQNF